MVKPYFNNLPQLKTSRFIIEVSFLAFGIKIIAALTLAGASLIPGAEMLSSPVAGDFLVNYFYVAESGSVVFPLLIILLFVLVAPIGETFFLQLLPIELLSAITGNPRFSILLSTILFATLHGFPDMLIMLPAGFIFAWSYYIQRDRSKRHGFLVTSALHAIQNAVVILIYYLDIFLTEDFNEIWLSFL